MLNEMPEMSKEAMQAANPVMKQWMASMMQRMQERARGMSKSNTPHPGTNSKAK